MAEQMKYQRYQRQLALNDFGVAAQEKLFNARVLVVGAGGLGCPALQYLAAAGVGTIGVVDFDVVELSNLQRQPLYSVDDVGKPKASTVVQRLTSFNPDIQFHALNVRLESRNALNIIDAYDVVLDGTDNFATRYLVNDACVLLGKPLIYGAVLRYEGQVGVFNVADGVSAVRTTYRDLVPEPPGLGSIPSCSDVGVLGVIPGIIGTLQATEAIKIITGVGKPLSNTIISYNALTNVFYDFEVTPTQTQESHAPRAREEFERFDYQWFCGQRTDDCEISPEEFDVLRAHEVIDIIDVREVEELPTVDDFASVRIPLSTFDGVLDSIPTTCRIVVICRSGNRSLAAVTKLRQRKPGCQAYSLRGGITAWQQMSASDASSQV